MHLLPNLTAVAAGAVLLGTPAVAQLSLSLSVSSQAPVVAVAPPLMSGVQSAPEAASSMMVSSAAAAAAAAAPVPVAASSLPTAPGAATAPAGTPAATPPQGMWMRLSTALSSWFRVPLSERLNRGIDSMFEGFSLLTRRPDGQGQQAWWEKPFSDRLNARIDAFQQTMSRIERRDVARVVQQLGLDGPAIWPDPVLTKADAQVDPQDRLTLLQAWRAARVNDPTLRAARAGLAAARERVPQARSQLLPQVQLGVSRFANDLSREGLNPLSQPINTFDRYPSSNETLSLRQPLLRAQQVVGVRQAQAAEQEALAAFAKEEQDFSSRVVLAYLEVLLAQDTMQAYASQRRFLESALAAATRGLAAGVGTRTDIDTAQARLDLNIAQALQARQQLELSRRQLQAFINRPFGELAPVDGERLPLLSANTYALEDWLQRATEGSPEIRRLQAQREGVKQELNKARSGHLPTLDFVAQAQRSRSENTTSPQSQYQNRSMGLQLNVPLYSGGYVNSVTRQVSAELERIDEALEALRLEVGLKVHREFRGVSEGLLRIKALEVALRSADVALDSARKSMTAGVRTSVDVLNAEQQRTQAWRDLCEARYSMMAAVVRLQGVAGETDEALVYRLNDVLVR